MAFALLPLSAVGYKPASPFLWKFPLCVSYIASGNERWDELNLRQWTSRNYENQDLEEAGQWTAKVFAHLSDQEAQTWQGWGVGLRTPPGEHSSSCGHRLHTCDALGGGWPLHGAWNLGWTSLDLWFVCVLPAEQQAAVEMILTLKSAIGVRPPASATSVAWKQE